MTRITLALLMLAPALALGHPLPGSAVLLDFKEGEVDAELRLPLDQLEIAFRRPIAHFPESVVPQYGAALHDYVIAHVHLVAPDGRPWAVRVGELKVELGENPVWLVVEVEMHPSAGASSRQFTLNYDVIAHELVTHAVLVSARRDWESQIYADDPELLGGIRWTRKLVVIDRTHGGLWNGFVGVFKLGVHHIAEGTYHLLFLLTLLLAAPLIARGKRWGGFAGVRPASMRLVKIVSALTLGHSLTLNLGATGWVRLPSQVVEVLIAISVLISAILAARPLFAGREAWVAGSFGLIHGLAFASVLSELGLDGSRMAASILGFNLGIEVMQLAVVLATAPWLMLLSRTPAYDTVRWVGALSAGVAAIGWVGERAWGLSNPVGAAVGGLVRHAALGVGLLAVSGLAATLARSARGHLPGPRWD